MSARLIVRPQVYWDLDEIAAFIQKDNPQSALRFLESAETTIDSLAQMPGIGSLYPLPRSRFSELRCFPIKDFRNYLAFYDRTLTTIEVVRVLHGGRNLRPILRRTP